MKKRTERKVFTFLVFVWILSVLIINICSVSATEQDQIKKTYNWLKNKCIGTNNVNWQTLDVEKHLFCILSLKKDLTTKQLNASYKNLLSKSFENGTCWGPGNGQSSESSCTTFNSALGKLSMHAFSSEGADPTIVSEWLLNRTIAYSNVFWYLQISSPEAVRCLIAFDKNGQKEGEISINDKGVFTSITDSVKTCFTDETYWLGLKPECASTTFNLSCEKDVKVNFFFKKTKTSNEFYVTNQLQEGQDLSINITSLCVGLSKGSTTCDYKSTLWTAYVFSSTGDKEKAKTFLPYLVMEEPGNLGLLPQAFLYDLTGSEKYAQEIVPLQQTDGLILAQTSLNYKYYDSAIAMLTKASINTNETKMHDKLVLLQKKEGLYYYWASSTSNGAGRDDLKDTSMLYYVLWSNYDPRPECIRNGYQCVDNCTLAGGNEQSGDCGSSSLYCCEIPQTSISCKDKYGNCKASCFSNNETQIGYECQTGVCCKLNSQSLCVSELRGNLCVPDPLKEVKCTNAQGLIIPFIQSGDPSYRDYCCKGTCTYVNKTCTELGGEVCEPNQGKSCQNGNNLPSTEQFCCRQGFCVQGAQTCSQKAGVRCNSGEECSQGTMVDASDTNGQMTCCTSGGRCLQSTCSETICNDGETCDASGYETMDALICCPGTCSAELQNCVDMGGQECFNDLVCSQSNIEAKDTTKCCIGTCKEKGTFPWGTVIIIIVILGLIALVYWLFKSGKIKMKGKGKEEDEFGFGNDSVDAGISGIEGFDKMPASGKPSKQQFKPLPGPILKQVPRMQAPSKPVQAQPKSSPTAKKPVKKTSSPLDENLAELEKLSKE